MACLRAGRHSRFLMLRRLLLTNAPAANALIRLMVGGIFLSEGIKKFFFLLITGAGPWSADAKLSKK